MVGRCEAAIARLSPKQSAHLWTSQVRHTLVNIPIKCAVELLCVAILTAGILFGCNAEASAHASHRPVTMIKSQQKYSMWW